MKFCDIHKKNFAEEQCLSCLFDALDKKKKDTEEAEYQKLLKGGLKKCPGHKGEIDYDRFGRCSRCGAFKKLSTQ
jgi:hypothetical protein